MTNCKATLVTFCDKCRIVSVGQSVSVRQCQYRCQCVRCAHLPGSRYSRRCYSLESRCRGPPRTWSRRSGRRSGSGSGCSTPSHTSLQITPMSDTALWLPTSTRSQPTLSHQNVYVKLSPSVTERNRSTREHHKNRTGLWCALPPFLQK